MKSGIQNAAPHFPHRRSGSPGAVKGRWRPQLTLCRSAENPALRLRSSRKIIAIRHGYRYAGNRFLQHPWPPRRPRAGCYNAASTTTLVDMYLLLHDRQAGLPPRQGPAPTLSDSAILRVPQKRVCFCSSSKCARTRAEPRASCRECASGRIATPRRLYIAPYC